MKEDEVNKASLESNSKSLLKDLCDFFFFSFHVNVGRLWIKKKSDRMKRADELFLWWNFKEFNVKFLIAVSKDLDCKALVLAVVHSSKTFMRIMTLGKPSFGNELQ